MKPIIYLDMDGVLSDIEHGIYTMFGYKVDIHDETNGNRSKIFKEFLPSYVAARGFEHEKVCDNAHKLVDYLYEHYINDYISLAILTSSGKFFEPTSEVVHQKKQFIEKNFPKIADIPFCVTTAGREKARLAHPNALLIDDHAKNCNLFRDAGGEAWHYKDSECSTAIATTSLFILRKCIGSVIDEYVNNDLKELIK